MLNVRTQTDDRFYSPHRDVAHNFPAVMGLLVDRLDKAQWPEMHRYLVLSKVGDKDVAAAVESLCKFVGSTGDNPGISMKEALRLAGWLDTKPEAKFAVLAHLGMILIGLHFEGARDVTFNNEGPARDNAKFYVRAKKIAAYLTMPRWRRRIYDLQQGVLKAFYALRGLQYGD